MPEYRRPSLLGANLLQLSEYLLAQGIQSSCRAESDAVYITIAGTSVELTSALVGFVNDPAWKAPLPGTLPAHVQHLADFLAATPVQLAALTQAQRDHATQDIIRVLKTLIDTRLG